MTNKVTIVKFCDMDGMMRGTRMTWSWAVGHHKVVGPLMDVLVGKVLENGAF